MNNLQLDHATHKACKWIRKLDLTCSQLTELIKNFHLGHCSLVPPSQPVIYVHYICSDSYKLYFHNGFLIFFLIKI